MSDVSQLKGVNKIPNHDHRHDDHPSFNYNMLDLMRLVSRHLGRLEVLRCSDEVPGLFRECKESEFIQAVDSSSLKKLEILAYGQSCGTPSLDKVFFG